MSTRESFLWLPFQHSNLRTFSVIKRIRNWIDIKRETQICPNRLRVAARVCIGEKSTASVVHVDGRRFLLASTPTSVSLIAELCAEVGFSETLRDVSVESTQKPCKPEARKKRVDAVLERSVEVVAV